MKRKIRMILLELGVPASLDGFEYIADLVELLITTRDRRIELAYYFVAKKHGVNEHNIYRGTKTAIKRMNRESDAWKKYIRTDISKNGEVLCTLAYTIREECENEQNISARDSK